MIYEIKDVEVKGLFDLKDLCAEINRAEPPARVSPETNIYMLKLLIEELGPGLVQKLCRQLIDDGKLKWEEEDDFEVEAILDYGEEEASGEKKGLYLIKWKGWTHEHNTWEPKNNLEGCEAMLEEFHYYYNMYGREGLRRYYVQYDNKEDTKRLELEEFIAKLLRTQQVTAELILSAYTPGIKSARMKQLRERRLLRAKRKCTIDLSNKRTKQYRERKIDQKQSLMEWEALLNQVYHSEPFIQVENTVDHEPQPDFFEYITKSKVMEGITLLEDVLVGCECEDCFSTKGQCCAAQAGAHFAYYKSRKLRLPAGLPIYECNSRCKCPPDCSNRVVQYGRKYKLCVFRTANNRGWGVKTLQRIPKGSFVIEYVGEIITNEEAERRGEKYDAQSMTYLFDLDFNDGDNPFTIDAKQMGNVSHFINHSCDPNLHVLGVWVEHLDIRLPRIALFAKREIAKGEEITFDYQMTVARYPDTDEEIPDEEEETEETPVSKKLCLDSDSPNEAISIDELTKEIEGVAKLPADLTSSETEVKVEKSDGEPTKLGDELFAIPEDKKLPNGGTEFNLPPTPAPSDNGSEVSKDTSPLRQKANKIKSPIKRKGGTSFKCRCGAKKCREYFYFY